MATLNVTIPNYPEYQGPWGSAAIRFTPCIIIIDCRSTALVQQQDRINEWLREFFAQTQQMYTREERPFRFDICILSVGDTIETLVDFTHDGNFSEVKLHHGTGASLDEAVDMALDLLQECNCAARASGCFYNPPRLYILSEDIIHYCFSLTDPQHRLRKAMVAPRRRHVVFFPVTIFPPYFRYTDWNNPNAYWHTLDSPMDRLLWASQDYWSEEVVEPDEPSVPLAPPTPSCLTLGI